MCLKKYRRMLRQQQAAAESSSQTGSAAAGAEQPEQRQSEEQREEAKRPSEDREEQPLKPDGPGSGGEAVPAAAPALLSSDVPGLYRGFRKRQGNDIADTELRLRRRGGARDSQRQQPQPVAGLRGKRRRVDIQPSIA